MEPSRVSWNDLPEAVRSRVTDILGGSVTDSRLQTRGTTPGVASRVVTDDGTRAFVKLAHASINPATPSRHRREADILAMLPQTVPAPRLLGRVEEDGWVGMVTTDIDGTHPDLPWDDEDIETTLTALSRIVSAEAPTKGLASFSSRMAHMGSAWTTFMDEPPADLDPWLAERLPDLAGRVDRLTDTCEGNCIVHGDVRSDNVLLRRDGQGAVLVDWSRTVVGPAWADAASLLADVVHTDGKEARWNRADELVNRIAAEFTPETHGAPTSSPIVDYIVALLGYCEAACRRPVPPGMPQLREFQRRRAERLRGWLWASDHLA